LIRIAADVGNAGFIPSKKRWRVSKRWYSGNGGYTSAKCVDTLIRLFNNIPEPDTLKRLKKPIENIFDKGNYKKVPITFGYPYLRPTLEESFFKMDSFYFP
jgi:hypothetical protein